MTEFEKYFEKNYKSELMNPIERIGVVNTLVVIREVLLKEQLKKAKWYANMLQQKDISQYQRECMQKVSGKLDFIDFMLKEIGVSKKERFAYQAKIFSIGEEQSD